MSLAGVMKKKAYRLIQCRKVIVSTTDGSKCDVKDIRMMIHLKLKFCPDCGRKCRSGWVEEPKTYKKGQCHVCLRVKK